MGLSLFGIFAIGLVFAIGWECGTLVFNWLIYFGDRLIAKLRKI